MLYVIGVCDSYVFYVIDLENKYMFGMSRPGLNFSAHLGMQG